jgi:hypothetical protein
MVLRKHEGRVNTLLGKASVSGANIGVGDPFESREPQHTLLRKFNVAGIDGRGGLVQSDDQASTLSKRWHDIWIED